MPAQDVNGGHAPPEEMFSLGADVLTDLEAPQTFADLVRAVDEAADLDPLLIRTALLCAVAQRRPTGDPISQAFWDWKGGEVLLNLRAETVSNRIRSELSGCPECGKPLTATDLETAMQDAVGRPVHSSCWFCPGTKPFQSCGAAGAHHHPKRERRSRKSEVQDLPTSVGKSSPIPLTGWTSRGVMRATSLVLVILAWVAPIIVALVVVI